MRSPGNYHLGKAVLQMTRGASARQRLAPVSEVIQATLQKTAAVDKKTLAVGVLGLAGLALAAIVNRKRA
jgi:hypothetical protein